MQYRVIERNDGKAYIEKKCLFFWLKYKEYRWIRIGGYWTVPEFNTVREAKERITEVIEEKMAEKKKELEKKFNESTKKIHGYP